MVWIHGGGFKSGSGDSSLYGPDFLIEKGVILVTLNYRLEILGFLCLDTEDVPGNAGMKDQVAALRWIKNNISHFGGDPKKITIFGESAGGASVSFLLNSPMCKGLFQRAILQSGVSTSNYATIYKPRDRAIALARQLGFEGDNDKELYEFFKNAPIKDLINVEVNITMAEELQPNLQLHFSICEEKIFKNNERFFDGNHFGGLKKGGIYNDVELMIGYTADEGFMYFGLTNWAPKLNNFNRFQESFCPMNLIRKLPIDDQINIGKKIKEYYYGKEKVTKKNLKPLAQYVGFSEFKFNIIQWARTCVKNRVKNIYFYRFSCLSERNVLSIFIGGKGTVFDDSEPMTCHGDDLMYIFHLQEIPVDKNSTSFKMIQNTVTLWSNFAKYGYV